MTHEYGRRSVSSMSESEGNDERPAFSWGRGFLHWLAASAIVVATMLVVAMIRGVGDPNKFSGALGDAVGKLLLPALGVSYLFQTGRRRVAIGITVGMIALFMGGLVLGLTRRASVAEMERSFVGGCAARCPAGVDTARCGALCECIWRGIRAAHPDDRALAEFLEAASKDRSGFEHQVKGLMTDCTGQASLQ